MLLSNGTELAYRVRVHPRARNVRLVISRHHGLVVTIPRWFARDRIPEVLERKRNWIERTLRRLPARPEPCRLPDRIVLEAIGEEWTVTYQPGTPNHLRLIRQSDRTLIAYGAVDRPEAVRKLFEQWLKIKGRQHLVPLLLQTAAELGYELRGVQVRAQRTLWGSCSHRNTISLNARLLLLPPDLVRYVLIHELVHIRHPNHSRRFWQTLATHVPDYRDRLKQLRHRMESLPV